MEYGSIEREIRIDAPPEIVFEVVSQPEHVRQWFPDDAHYECVPGGTGQVVFHMPDGDAVEAIEIVDVIPPRVFSFRWTQPAGERARQGNSYLVIFELEPDGDGTLLRMSETGFRERGWEAAVLEEVYRDHSGGWDQILPRLAPYVASYLARVR